MKIGIITSTRKGQGMAQFIYRDLKELDNRGHDIKIFFLRSSSGICKPELHWKIVKVNLIFTVIKQPIYFIQYFLKYLRCMVTGIRTLSLFDFLIATYFCKEMKDREIILSYFGDDKFYIGYYIKQLLSLPLAVSIRAYELFNNPNLKMFKEALKFADKIMTNTEYNRQYLVQNFNLSQKDVDVIRIILDIDAYTPNKKFKILIAGFFMEKKGHEILFKAIKKLGMDDIEVWVVGGPVPNEKRSVDCERLVKEIGIETQVIFFGILPENTLRVLYRECDIFCLPSRTTNNGDREGFPNVIAEAMASGKPVISTKHVEIPTILPEILIQENNVDELAIAIKNIKQSPKERERIGKQNFIIAENTFSKKNIDILEKKLKSLI